MEQANLQGALIPYLFHELLDRHGGTIEFDAAKIKDSVSSKEDRGVAISIVDGILIVKLIDKDDMDADENQASK